VLRISDDEFHRLCCDSSRGTNGEERGGLGPFIGGGRLAEGARVWAYLDRRASRGAVRREESGPSLVMVLTSGAGVSASRGERGAYRFGVQAMLGRGLLLRLGRK
jgi:hypothetical protein